MNHSGRAQEEDPLDTLHPVVVQFFALLRAGPEPEEPLLLDEEHVHDLYSVLFQFEARELEDIVDQLAWAALALLERGCPNLAAQLLAILNDDDVIALRENAQPLLQGSKTPNDSCSKPESPEILARRRADFDRLLDRSPTPKPSSVNASKPSGALSIDRLNFPRRL